MPLNISIDNGQIFLSDDKITRYVKPSVFVAALFSALNKYHFDLGLLPPGTCQVKVSPDSAVYFIEFPASVQPIRFRLSDFSSSGPVIFAAPIALPSLLFTIIMRRKAGSFDFSSMHVHAVESPLCYDSHLYIPPLPNIYPTDNSAICLGSEVSYSSTNYNDVASWAVSYFFSSEFNSDLSNHLRTYLSRLISLIIKDSRLDLINPATPVGRCLLDSYSQDGLLALLASLFSQSTHDIFYDTYVKPFGCDKAMYTHCLSVISSLADLPPDKLFGCITDNYSLFTSPLCLILSCTLMSALASYPVSVLDYHTSYSSYVTNVQY